VNAKPQAESMHPRRFLLPLILATGLTALNALKAPVIDDPVYLSLARQIAQHPFDPYGFQQFWYHELEPANHILAPPVQPYWLALGMHVLGNDPVWLKVWLFPFAFLLVFSLQALLRRFARGTEAPLLTLLVLSPALLPAWNFMLDIPALSFSLTALALFLHGLERCSVKWALLAGLLAGLAAQTKYTGMLVLPVFLGAALLCWRRPAPQRTKWIRRMTLGILACILAASVFVSWETFTWWKYGESHFLFAFHDNDHDSWLDKWRWAMPMIVLLGGLAPPAALLGLAGLHRNRSLLCAAVGIVLAAYLALILIPIRESVWFEPYPPIRAASIVFGTLGCLSIFALALAVLRQLVRWSRSWRWPRFSPNLWFLLYWWLIETIGYFAMTPFPACRRLMGWTLVATLIAGRLISRSCRTPLSPRWGDGGKPSRHTFVWLAAIPGICLGLFYAGIDLADSRQEPAAVRESADFIQDLVYRPLGLSV